MNLTLKGWKSFINIIQLLLFFSSIWCLRHKLQIFYNGRQCTVALRSSIQIFSEWELQTCSYCLCYHFVLQIKNLLSFLPVYYGSYRRRVQKYQINVYCIFLLRSYIIFIQKKMMMCTCTTNAMHTSSLSHPGHVVHLHVYSADHHSYDK